MKIYVLNGPNLNMLGIREPKIYGTTSYEELKTIILEYAKDKKIQVEIYQSNHEGELVDLIQKAYFEKVDGIVLNAGAYTHTSIALLDALKTVNVPCVEVHISNVDSREDFRKISYIREVAKKTISGQGINGYLQAIDYLLEVK